MNQLINYGFDTKMIEEGFHGEPARILAVHKDRYELICEQGEVYGRLKKGVYYGREDEVFPTCGDFVLIEYNPSGDSQIVKTLDRRTKFARSDFSGHGAGYVKTIKEQVVAANFDYVFIFQSLNYDFNLGRLERYLTLAWQSGGIPVVVLTKADLVEDFEALKQDVERLSIGVDVVAVSSVTRFGFQELEKYLTPGKTIVLLGSSGVGKSSFVNALFGETMMQVKEIREDDSRGRHTTTHRQLMMLERGVMLIDTPGMREVGMWDISSGLEEAFADVESYLGKCKYSDCQHVSEPGCAILEAISEGDLPQERWESYQKIQQEARFVEDKSSFLRQKEMWHKTISKHQKQLKKQKGGF